MCAICPRHRSSPRLVSSTSQVYLSSPSTRLKKQTLRELANKNLTAVTDKTPTTRPYRPPKDRDSASRHRRRGRGSDSYAHGQLVGRDGGVRSVNVRSVRETLRVPRGRPNTGWHGRRTRFKWERTAHMELRGIEPLTPSMPWASPNVRKCSYTLLEELPPPSSARRNPRRQRAAVCSCRSL